LASSFRIPALIALLVALIGCAAGRKSSGSADPVNAQSNANVTANNHSYENSDSPNSARVIHVLVALCDNVNQGIVPVPPRLGNGEDLQNNLYWGAAYGVKTFFAKSADWKLVPQVGNPKAAVLERCVFKRKNTDVYLVADAYRGAEIKQTITDFLEYASGNKPETVGLNSSPAQTSISIGGGSDLVVFVGHNGLMDFNLSSYPKKKNDRRRDAVMLCCASRSYFYEPLREAGANPVLWTTGLMAPEAYILKALIDGWILNESGEKIRARAAQAYNTYQRCGLKAARNLFSSGW
jgi:hypothetical protein